MTQFRPPYLFRWIFHRRIWGFSVREPYVYLTFDDGPTDQCTEWILKTLDAYNAKATFFCVGTNALNHPELLQKIKAHGHTLGNHTMHHERGTKTEKKAYFESINQTKELIDSKLFRPPYGRIPMKYTSEVRKEYDILMWTWLSYDYDQTVPIESILNSAKSIKAGDIIVLHDNKKSFERLQIILPKLLEIIEAKNLGFKAISS